MSPRLLELATRHGALKVKIDAQRSALAKHTGPVESALSRGDAVLRGVDWLKHHPAAVGAALAAAVLARPKRAWRWAKRGFVIWRGVQSLRKALFAGR